MSAPPDSGTPDDAQVQLNEPEDRYEITTEGTLAGFLEYRESSNEIAFTHIETFEEYSGRGYAASLTAAALSDAATRGKTIVPSCPFVADYIRDHPDAAPEVRWPDSPETD